MQDGNWSGARAGIRKWLWGIVCLATVMGCVSCHSNPEPKMQAVESQTISGRDEGEGRQAVYRMYVPTHWIRHDALPEETLTDSTKALCEFIIMENSEILRISVHNFPTAQIDDRIPPSAQVARWRNQFEILNEVNSTSFPQSFSGFSGLLFSGEGKMQGKDMAVLAWSLQLAPEHYRTLQRPLLSKEAGLYKQMRADVTIKVIGPPAMMHKHRQAIVRSARSFELIREIPTRS